MGGQPAVPATNPEVTHPVFSSRVTLPMERGIPWGAHRALVESETSPWSAHFPLRVSEGEDCHASSISECCVT